MNPLRHCAIFDLDETLIRPKSMLAVLEAYRRAESETPALAHERVAELRRRLGLFIERNSDRRAQNRFFYQQLAGIPVASMAAVSQAWFNQNRAEMYHQHVVQALKDHQRDGAVTIVVSGSFSEAAAPVLNDLGIDHFVCAELEIVDGRYTGRMLSEPTIGEGKAEALVTRLGSLGLSLEASHAYADHDSDIPMLTLATHPVVVGDCGPLLRHAQAKHWRIFNPTERRTL